MIAVIFITIGLIFVLTTLYAAIKIAGRVSEDERNKNE